MTYPIWISASTDGFGYVGSANRNWLRDNNGPIKLADSEQVYASQIPHRVVAETADGFRLMTPTQAEKQGLRITYWFSLRRW